VKIAHGQSAQEGVWSCIIATKATFCQLPTTCFHGQPCTCNRLGLRLLSSLKLRQTNITGDSCDGAISVLNMSWSKFVILLQTLADSGLTYTSTLAHAVYPVPRFFTHSEFRKRKLYFYGVKASHRRRQMITCTVIAVRT